MRSLDGNTLWGESTLIRVGNSIGWLYNDGWERVEIETGIEGTRLIKVYRDGQTVNVALWEIDR